MCLLWRFPIGQTRWAEARPAKPQPLVAAAERAEAVGAAGAVGAREAEAGLAAVGRVAGVATEREGVARAEVGTAGAAEAGWVVAEKAAAEEGGLAQGAAEVGWEAVELGLGAAEERKGPIRREATQPSMCCTLGL